MPSELNLNDGGPPKDNFRDRNLLYAMMALRLGLLNTEQMLAGLHAWTDARSERIESIFFRLGFINESDHSFLEGVMARHLKSEGGDESSGPNASPTDSKPTLAWLPMKERYRIVSLYKKGGLGKVSLGYDSELRREVAIKQIRDRFVSHSIFRERFAHEAEVTGQLEHPNILPVYDIGCSPDGRPFYVMRMVRGDDFKSMIDQVHGKGPHWSRENRSEFRKLLLRFLDVCNAVQYAHGRGILHRDIKPQNIVLGRYGETYLLDWGLAKKFQRAKSEISFEEKAVIIDHDIDSASIDGAIIGSPGFLSPEQAKGERDQLSPATDIFGLGATLYYLLTGQPPQADESPEHRVADARVGNFPTPDQLALDIPRRLCDICLKAMAFEPQDRYQSADQLRKDLWDWLSDEPLMALKATAEYFEQLSIAEPEQSAYRLRLARELTTLSKIYQASERFDEALKIARRAVELLNELNAAQSEDLNILNEWYYARVYLASLLKTAGLAGEAAELETENARKIQELWRQKFNESRIPKSIIDLTLHQGFTTEEIQRLLSRAASEESSASEPTWSDEDGTVHNIGDGRAGWYSGQDWADDHQVPERYQLVQQIGQGGIAMVFKAVDLQIPRTVAIKVAHSTSRSTLVNEIMAREIAVLLLLDHENIVPILDGDHNCSHPLIVTKLVEQAESLYSLIARLSGDGSKLLSYLPFLLRALLSICRAVQTAHERGIVHGDPKPSNILIDKTGKAWLIDWGLSQVFDGNLLRHTEGAKLDLLSSGLKEALFARFDAEGQIIGTLPYLPPERCETDSPPAFDEKTDVFALGGILYQILTGACPNPVNKDLPVLESLEVIQKGMRPNPRVLNPKVPRKLEAICLKALATDREKRYYHVTELADDLTAWLRSNS
jgi:serine/threonine protein kinase